MARPKVGVVIPTVEGREEYLERCIRGYEQRTPGVDLHLSVVHNAASCGIAWQAGAERSAAPTTCT